MRSTPVCLALPVIAWLCGAAAAAEVPRRIVSFDRCGDQLVLALADRDQIAGLSIGARDPRGSLLAERAAGLPMLLARPEVAIKAGADLVLLNPAHPARTRALLAAARIRTADIEPPDDLRQAVAQVREVAALVGWPARGEALVAEIAAAEQRLAAARPPRPLTALALDRRTQGFGSRRLLIAYLGAAGFVPPPQVAGGAGQTLTLERLLAAAPDVLVVTETPDPDAAGEPALDPTIERRWPPARRLAFPERYWLCGGLAIPAAFDHVADWLRAFAR